MVTGHGPGGPGAADHMLRMEALLERHPNVTHLRPGQAGVARETATWLEVSGDHRIDGTPVTVSKDTLAELVDYLIARLD
jgi:hypothetical protein